MAWFWGFLIFFIVLMAASFWFGYVRAVDMVGREAAHRNLRYMFPCLLFGLALALVIPFLGKYGWIIFYLLYSVGVSLWLLSWVFRKKESGTLLINIGRTSVNKFLFWIGVIEALVAILQTWLFFEQVSVGFPRYTSLELEVSRLIYYWFFASHFLAIGLSRLEFRENGICFMYTFVSWQRLNSYNWEQSKPNTLTIRLKPRFLSLPGFLSIPIPTKHRDAVSHILEERLSAKNL